jgi:hypothetical protein
MSGVVESSYQPHTFFTIICGIRIGVAGDVVLAAEIGGCGPARVTEKDGAANRPSNESRAWELRIIRLESRMGP